MAAYQPGDMNIEDQRSTFVGFLQAGLWCALLVAALVIFLVLTFAVHLGWFTSLIVSALVTVPFAMFMGAKAPYYGFLAGYVVLTAFVSIIASLVHGAIS